MVLDYFDQLLLLGRFPSRTAEVAAELFSGASAGTRVPGPWGSAHDRSLSARGVHPHSPSGRFALRRREAGGPFLIDAMLLSAVFNRRGSFSTFVEPLNLYLQRYQVSTIARLAAFFGQADVETEGLSAPVENLNYTTEERLGEVFASLRLDPRRREDVGNPGTAGKSNLCGQVGQRQQRQRRRLALSRQGSFSSHRQTQLSGLCGALRSRCGQESRSPLGAKLRRLVGMLVLAAQQAGSTSGCRRHQWPDQEGQPLRRPVAQIRVHRKGANRAS